MKTNKIIKGEALEELKKLATDSVDFICTDPPYQLSSITKPRSDRSERGSYGKEVPFSRVQARAGFMGKEWDILPVSEVWNECLRILKPGAFMCVMTTPRQDSLTQVLIDITQAGFNMSFSSIYWTYASGFPKAGNIGKMVDKRLGNERNNTPHTRKDTGFRFQAGGRRIIVPQSEQAKALDGSYAGFQPKPAVEVIIVAMKPLSEKTYVDQAINNRKGISWLDDARIPTGENLNGGAYSEGDSRWKWEGGKHQRKPGQFKQPQGRFPANLLVSDEVLDDGNMTRGTDQPRNNSARQDWEGDIHKSHISASYADVGGYSRYFNLDKWASTLPFLIVPKAGKREKNKGLDNLKPKLNPTMEGVERYKNRIENGVPTNTKAPVAMRANHHPTVKPLKLMSYLITLFSREGDVVLDPFCGSGTTCIATKQLARKYLGIEREHEYVEIARARLETASEPDPTLL